jgi:hypothetical protein
MASSASELARTELGPPGRGRPEHGRRRHAIEQRARFTVRRRLARAAASPRHTQHRAASVRQGHWPALTWCYARDRDGACGARAPFTRQRPQVRNLSRPPAQTPSRNSLERHLPAVCCWQTVTALAVGEGSPAGWSRCRPVGLGYQSHTWRGTRSGCQKLKLKAAPLWGLRLVHLSGEDANTRVPSL